MTVNEFICFSIIPLIIALHYIHLVISDESKYQKRKLRNRLTLISSHLTTLNETADDGIRFHELKVICRNREFLIGVLKKDHNYRYCTYAIFINGDEAGTLHQIGDCCRSEYYFEKQNNREFFAVMEIIKAGAKEVKKLNRATTEKKDSWNEYSYFK